MRKIMFCAAVIWGVGCSTTGLGQVAGGRPVVPDTLPGPTFGKRYTGTIKGNVNRVSMSNKFLATLKLGNGMTASTTLSIGEASYRLQDRRDNTKSFSASLTAVPVTGLALSGTLSDNRFFNRVLTFSNAVQEFVNNTQKADASVTYFKTLAGGVTFNGTTSVGASTSEQTFIEEQAFQGMIRGELTYSLGDRVKWRGAGYLRSTDERADTGGRGNKGLGADEDSLVASLSVRLNSTSKVRADYRRFARTKKFMDLPRGVFLEQQFDEELIREVETRASDVLKIDADMTVLPNMTFKLTGEHSEGLTDFAVAKKRFSETVTDRIRGTLKYTIRKGTTFDVNLENSETLHDLGPQSLGSFTDKRQSLKFALIYPMTSTLKLQLQTGASLLQNFYKDFDVNPRDRDQVDQYANVRINSSPFPKITAQVYLSVSQTHFVNIDGSLSQNNRRETTYDFRPEFTYSLNHRISIRQAYGLNIEFTEFDFTEDDNFLDRNFAFSNTVKFEPFESLSTEVYYALVLHDRGSYLRPAPGEGRLLDINQEDRRDEMSIVFRYKLNPHLTVVGRNDYSQRKDQFGQSARENVFTDGGVEVGAEGHYDFGEERNLTFRLKRVKKFGRFNTEEQEDYWEMDSSLNFKF